MKVDFINSSYRRYYKAHKKEIDKAIQDRLKTGSLIFCGEAEKFEREFARFCGKKYCVGVSSGTTAIKLAMSYYEHMPYFRGDWLRQDYSYKIPALSNKKTIGIKDGAMNLAELESELKSEKLNVFITYMNSAQPNLKELQRLKDKYNFYLIEDACQAIGKPLIGDVSCFSFYPAKILGGIAKGGAVVSDNEELMNYVRDIRDDKFNNYWLDEMNAAFLNVKLKHLPDLIRRRQQIADTYNEELGQIVNVLSPQCLQNYIILAENSKLLPYLQSQGIEALPDKTDFYDGNLENAIRLPTYPELTDKQVCYVIEKIKEFYS